MALVKKHHKSAVVRLMRPVLFIEPPQWLFYCGFDPRSHRAQHSGGQIRTAFHFLWRSTILPSEIAWRISPCGFCPWRGFPPPYWGQHPQSNILQSSLNVEHINLLYRPGSDWKMFSALSFSVPNIPELLLCVISNRPTFRIWFMIAYSLYTQLLQQIFNWNERVE